jgi:hypothetical protein
MAGIGKSYKLSKTTCNQDGCTNTITIGLYCPSCLQLRIRASRKKYRAKTRRETCTTPACSNPRPYKKVYCVTCQQERDRESREAAAERYNATFLRYNVAKNVVGESTSWYDNHPPMPADEERRLRKAQLDHDAKVHAKWWEGKPEVKVLSREEIEAVSGTITPIERIPKNRVFTLYVNY